MKIAGAMVGGLALVAAGQAGAQRMVQPGPGAGYPPPGPQVRYPPLPPAPVQPVRQGRWGSNIGGHWWGGVNAPGGWAAYRQPYRGYRLPGYWVAPRFYVNDWQTYGFAAPQPGYTWTRYYDDAVLVDGRGEVYDTVGGVDWNRYDDGYPDDGYADDRARRDRNGVAGAAVGAVVGGVAGNVIAGRGNRLGGTLIGAGVGAAAGYAVGSSGGHRRGPPPATAYSSGDSRFGPPPVAYSSGDSRWAPPPPPYREERTERRYEGPPGYPPPPPPPSWVSQDGRTTVTVTTSSGGGPVVYAPPPAYGYGYGGATTVVTVQTAPVVTTTTTEIVEDSVTWTRPVVRGVWRRRAVVVCPPAPVHHWRPRPRYHAPRVIGS